MLGLFWISSALRRSDGDSVVKKHHISHTLTHTLDVMLYFYS